MKNTNEKDIEQLNSFLKGELSAVETYRQCIEKMDDASVVLQLQKLQASHAQRVFLLTEKIRALGGMPAGDSGVWGSFAKLVEGGSKLFGKAAAISTLEEGEDHGKKDYLKDVGELSPTVRSFVENQIIPEQLRTHDALSSLQERV